MNEVFSNLDIYAKVQVDYITNNGDGSCLVGRITHVEENKNIIIYHFLQTVLKPSAEFLIELKLNMDGLVEKGIFCESRLYRKYEQEFFERSAKHSVRCVDEKEFF